MEQGDGIKLTCSSSDGSVSNVTANGINQPELILTYKDSHSGEYGCNDVAAIYVKFRSKCSDIFVSSRFVMKPHSDCINKLYLTCSFKKVQP